MKKVLLISSCGGHFVQMSRLAPAFEKHDVYWASTEQSYAQKAPQGRFYFVPDASQTSSKFQILKQAFCVLKLLIKLRPDVILTTGAAPGFFALFFGKKLKMKTIWVDSIANVDKMSLSGQKAKKYADLYITQWPELAKANDAEYYGAVV